MAARAAPEKGWTVEYAKSGRASCRTCKDNIGKEVLRFGKMVQSQHFDGFMPMWHHAACIMRKANQIKSVDDVKGIESLRWEDQQKLRKYIDGSGVATNTNAAAPARTEAATAHGIEVAQSSRATCKHCTEKIMKGEVRISAKADGRGAKGLSWYHSLCFLELSPSTLMGSISGWESLPPSEQVALLSASRGKAPVLTDGGLKNGGAKRKIAGDVESGNQRAKIGKVDADMMMSPQVSNHGSGDEEAAWNKKLEAQTKALWDLKDNLKKYLSTAELRQMLEANNQITSGSELLLRDRCADHMMFGALGRCPQCGDYLHFSGHTYKCHGYISEWSKCSYSTTQPERVNGKWNIPEEIDNEFLLKWSKSDKAEKPARLLPSSSPFSQNQSANGQHGYSKHENLGDLRVAIAGVPKETLDEFRHTIEDAGGQVHAKITKETNCLVVGGGLSSQNAEMKKARRMKIPIVRKDYLVGCIQRMRMLPFDFYKIEAREESASMVTVKVKGRSAVHEASGLQDSGHILEDGTSIYNTTLNMSDLSTGVNSYYILQIIKDDNGPDCYVFRKWGRVGNEKIGNNKLEEMSKSDAIEQFKKLFYEKTGNSWESWLRKKDFRKQPGRFYPLDIDYGVNKPISKKNLDDRNSQLAPALKELIKMLFNVETYRAAMLEFEINLSEMPLGKLSKSNIQKGFEVLTQIQNLMGNADLQPSNKESLIIDASNRFFTMIPSTHPHVIRDEDDFKAKVKMLEALQDIEIASNLVGFDEDNDESLDQKYEKLRCDIVPLSRDCEEYQLIKKYLLTTHAPSHDEWTLELEDVFSLEREGETDKFAPVREKLGNRMLLWHGSRLTNFVGILSQGLRIAPPEAPATGYMFGKGVYFADLVSKSAQYCFTDRRSPVGLMLLSEVALGKVHELKRAQYMDKPPRGKHSTKGLGKIVPDEKAFTKWRDEIVVPSGKPVKSKVISSELNYNEYIVYDTAQVKMQFLLKVRFHYRR